MAENGALTLMMTEEHIALQRAVRDFAQKEIVPIAAEFDESGEFPCLAPKIGMNLMLSPLMC